MTLEIQKFLREYEAASKSLEGTLAELEALHHITAKQHSRFSGLWLFKYDQIESDFSKKIVQECRGIILDHDNNWNVVAAPFYKFFNQQETLAAQIDWSTARVQEKLDGSLITLYFYGGQWNVATSGCPDGLNKVGDFDNTFEDFFWTIFDRQGLQKCKLNNNYTYMWELTSPFNRVVVDHKESRVTLIGVRNTATLQEKPVSDFRFEFPVVVEYPLSNLVKCMEAAFKLNPLEHEGYVVVDDCFNRIKIKSPAYVALHHLKDSCSSSRLAEIIRAGEYEEFLIAIDSYPEIKQKFLEMNQRYECRINWCHQMYDQISGIENQKEFAAEALKYGRNSSILFSMRKTGKSAKAVVKNMTKNAYLNWLEVKENDL